MVSSYCIYILYLWLVLVLKCGFTQPKLEVFEKYKARAQFLLFKCEMPIGLWYHYSDIICFKAYSIEPDI